MHKRLASEKRKSATVKVLFASYYNKNTSNLYLLGIHQTAYAQCLYWCHKSIKSRKKIYLNCEVCFASRTTFRWSSLGTRINEKLCYSKSILGSICNFFKFGNFEMQIIITSPEAIWGGVFFGGGTGLLFIFHWVTLIFNLFKLKSLLT